MEDEEKWVRCRGELRKAGLWNRYIIIRDAAGLPERGDYPAKIAIAERLLAGEVDMADASDDYDEAMKAQEIFSQL